MLESCKKIVTSKFIRREVKIEGSEKAGCRCESNPGNLWLEPRVLKSYVWRALSMFFTASWFCFTIGCCVLCNITYMHILVPWRRLQTRASFTEYLCISLRSPSMLIPQPWLWMSSKATCWRHGFPIPCITNLDKMRRDQRNCFLCFTLWKS